MKKLKILAFIFTNTILYAQVGINTNGPKATLDIVGHPTETTEIDGVLIPRIFRSELISKTGYGTDQIGLMIYVKDLSGTTNSQTTNVDEIGYYYFDGTVWVKIANNNKFGDIKLGFQSIDHSGWVKLDGRLTNTLTTTQQAQATALGFGTNLPNATNAYFSQNGGVLGSVTGSNTKTIAQNQLPNVTITTTNEGLHSHTFQKQYRAAVDITGGNSSQGIDNGNAYQAQTTSSDGDHTHSLNLNGNVTQEEVDIKPLTLDVNVYIYLGN